MFSPGLNGSERAFTLENNHRCWNRGGEFHPGEQVRKDFPKLFEADGNLPDLFIAAIADKKEVL